jgi:hypothetical protein
VNTAFYVVFTLFVLAMVGLAFTAVRWAVRRDRLARAEQSEAGPTDPAPKKPVTGP